MHDRQTIQSLQANEEARSVFLVGQSSLQQSRNGPYWRLELRDATGSLEAKIWSPLSGAFSELPPGRFAMVSGRTSLYKDQLQLSIDSLRLLEAEEEDALHLGDFMPASPRDGEEMLLELESICDRELKHKPWRKFVRSVLADEHIRSRFVLAPAAKAVHHAYLGGLLEHSLSVAGICLRLAEHYGEELDRQTLLCAALFHDIGKLEELSGGLVNDYTDSGKLLGHIVQGLILLDPFLRKAGVEPELALHFRHLISSHHGTHEFASPSLPATAEAFLLHYADNIDAKMAQLRAQFPEQSTASADSTPEDTPGEEGGIVWSAWNSLLNRRLARMPHTPQGKAGSGRVKKGEPASPGDDRQCSLL